MSKTLIITSDRKRPLRILVVVNNNDNLNFILKLSQFTITYPQVRKSPTL
jgi:hypothetical protein